MFLNMHPKNYMNANSKLTILIPTKNRPQFLSKVLEYYSQIECSRFVIMIGDASDPLPLQKNIEAISQYNNALNIIHYKHDPKTSSIESSIRILNDVQTPYCVWAGDDDYMIPASLGKCVAFLDSHEDHSLACGEAAWVYVDQTLNNTFKILSSRRGTPKNIQQSQPSRRLVELTYSAFYVNTFSVQRTKNMRSIWQKASAIGLDLNNAHHYLHEVSTNVVSLMRGKQAVLPGLYHVMLRHNVKYESSRPVDLFLKLTMWNWEEQIAGMMSWWAEELEKAEKIDNSTALDISRSIFLYALIPFLSRHRERILAKHHLSVPSRFLERAFKRLSNWAGEDVYSAKKIWKRVTLGFNQMSLPILMDKKSIYYKDFMPVYNFLANSKSSPKLASGEVTNE